MDKGFYGLIGERLSHSISPLIHAIIFKKLGIDGCYHIFEVERGKLPVAVDGLKALGAKGVNVTIPYKESIMENLDFVSGEAKKIGAVNTVCFRDGSAMGYNTDYYGFKAMLDRFKVEIKNRRFAILGSGGAAKAVARCLEDFGAGYFCVVSTSQNLPKEGFEGIDIIGYSEIAKLQGMDAVINCTPCGMHPKNQNSPLKASDVSRFPCVVDLIYNPRTTLLMEYGRSQGAVCVNGLYMLVAQAVKAQEIWNGAKLSAQGVEDIFNQVEGLV